MSNSSYRCPKCGKNFSQKSHYTEHMKKKTPCISEKEINKKVIAGEIIKNELILQKPDRTIVWTRKEEKENNLQNESQEQKDSLQGQFDSLIKQCHQILYNNGAVVGKPAMNDIMKILTLKLLQPLFDDGLLLKIKFDEMYSQENSDNLKKKLVKYYETCKNFKKLIQSDNLTNDWKMLVKNFLGKTNMLCSIFDNEKDIFFNANDIAIKEIIIKIDSCSVFDQLTKENKDNMKYYDSVSGYIYEYFMNKYVSGGGKDLGQFFTPRNMIDLMVYGLKLQDYVNINKNTTIYDPCAGSGGFLTRLYNCFPKINPNNIYGGEIENDTMKFCISNLLLSTSTFCSNLVNEDSIIYEDGKKHNIIFTNPPFGTSMKYQKDKKGEGLKEKYKNEHNIEFTDMYPIKTNDGASLFTQKCVFKLKQNGVLCIVLPDGQLFFGKNFRKFRKWLSENLNIRAIVQAPSGVFEHAGIKTCILFGTKDGETKKIQFLKTNKECNYLEKIVEISSQDLMLGEYSLDPKDYLEDEYLSKLMESSNVPVEKIKDMCILNMGQRITQKNEGTLYNVYGAGNSSYKYDKYNREGKFCKITRFCVRPPTCVMIINEKCWITDSSFTIHPKNKDILNEEYLGHFMMKIKDKLLNIRTGGLQPGLNMNLFKKIKIPIPSLEIQEKIVKKLDKLEKVSNTLKQLLEETKEEREIYQEEKYFNDIRTLIRGCEWKKLGDICKFAKKSKRPASYGQEEGKYNFYTSSYNIKKCNVNDYKNELIIVGTGGNPVISLDNNFSCSADNLLININTAETNNKYVYDFIKFCIPYGILKMKGSSIKHITKDTIKKIQIPLPSLEVQQQCIELYQKKEAKLKWYDEEIKRLKNRIKEIQELGRDVIVNVIGPKLYPDMEDYEPIEEDEEMVLKETAKKELIDEIKFNINRINDLDDSFDINQLLMEHQRNNDNDELYDEDIDNISDENIEELPDDIKEEVKNTKGHFLFRK